MKTLNGSFFIFAVFQVVLFCLGFTAAGMGMGGLFGAQSAGDINLGMNLVYVGGALSVLTPILLILSLVTAFALRAEKDWGRATGIVTGIISVLEFPIGTIFGIYWLVKFFAR